MGCIFAGVLVPWIFVPAKFEFRAGAGWEFPPWENRRWHDQITPHHAVVLHYSHGDRGGIKCDSVGDVLVLVLCCVSYDHLLVPCCVSCSNASVSRFCLVFYVLAAQPAGGPVYNI